MGIDVYARWRNQKKDEKEKQFTGFRLDKGDVGYLREGYHGEPYATKHMFKETFNLRDGTREYDAAELVKRLPHTLMVVRERAEKVYNMDLRNSVEDKAELVTWQNAYIDFVDLCVRKQKETGHPITIETSY
jgi:hypothetical protein